MTRSAAVVFDVGGVLSAPPFEALERYAAELGLSHAALSAFFVDDPEFSRVERGELAMRDFLGGLVTRVAAAHGVFPNPQRVVACLREARELRPEMLDLALELSAGHDLGVLTNNVRENDTWLVGQLPAGIFTTVVNSAVAGVRKPDPAAYLYLLERLGRPGADVVYIDDFAVNLPPARALGMTTILFASPQQCRRELIALGVLPVGRG